MGRSSFSLSLLLLPACRLLAARAGAVVVFERDVQLYPVARHLAVLDRQVLLDDFGDAEVADGLGGGLDGSLRGRLPRLAARPDDLCHAIDAVGHRRPPTSAG